MEKFKMELMDWKLIERQAEEQYRAASMQIELAMLMYERAIIEIKKLGGMTNREEDQEARKRRDKPSTAR